MLAELTTIYGRDSAFEGKKGRVKTPGVEYS